MGVNVSVSISYPVFLFYVRALIDPYYSPSLKMVYKQKPQTVVGNYKQTPRAFFQTHSYLLVL
jgi:hypothetical protein